jgi:hypothetical protein
LKNIDCDFLAVELIKKLNAWIYDSASSGARLTFLDSTFSGIPSYYMAMFLLNKTFGLEKKRIFYYMVNCKRVCRSKNKGGLGVKDLRKENIILLTKWWRKLETQDGIW